jgi:adenosylmethionine-8-amino-7-oxononanoate aminotransferase
VARLADASVRTDVAGADRRHVWHPYEPMPAVGPAIPVLAAHGVRLQLADGRQVIDAMSSWWAAIHGYRHPTLDAAVRDQLGRMAHVMFGGLTHPPATALAERLVALTGLDCVFFADSGSVAVEVAMKMALQYWQGRGSADRHRFLTVRGGYHGDTFAAMSVCDPVNGMHRLFSGVLAQQVFAEAPPAGFDAEVDQAYAARLADLVRVHAGELAGIIVEPVVQGAGGMRFYAPAYLRLLRQLCDEFDLLLVFDEIATGFGRTGRLFAAEHAGVSADIVCVGKALTGGYLSLAATLCTRAVAATVSSAGAGGALMHGPTFMANPLACAVAGANLDLLASWDWPARVRRIGELLAQGLAPAAGLPTVADVRTLGGIGVVQTREPVDVGRASAAALRSGVWLRPFRDLIYTMPPYVCSDAEIETICAALLAALRAGTSR